jgi:hypothetical protein
MNDEQIARLADALTRAKQRVSISEGPVKINDRYFAFARTQLFDAGIFVYLPEDFTDMPEDVTAIKYPSSNRPKIIKADERGAVCFTFDVIDNPLDAESVPELVSGMRAMLQKLNPSFLFFESEESETETEENPAIGSIAYKSPAIDEAVYNVMFFASINGKTLMGTFSCPYGEHDEWKDIVSEILDLIEIEEEKENA